MADIITSITFKDQSKDFAAQEAVIDASQKAFIPMGAALCQITNREYYQERGFSTLEQYVNLRFDMTRDYAYKHMAAYRIISILKDAGFTPSQLPKTESQARPMTKLNGESGEKYQLEIVPTWQRVIDANCRITAALVTKEVNKTLGKSEPKETTATPPEDNTGSAGDAPKDQDKGNDTPEADKVYTKADIDALNYRIAALKQQNATLEAKLGSERENNGGALPQTKLARDLVQAGFKALAATATDAEKVELVSIKKTLLGL